MKDDSLCFSYGEAKYIEEQKRYEGQLILDSNKIYLKGPDGEIPQTFCALSRIARMQQRGNRLLLDIRSTVVTGYQAAFVADQNKFMDEIKSIL